MWTPGTLPNIRRGPNASSHPYPFQIAIRAQTFIAGATFYYAVASAGLGEYFSAGPSSYECIKNLFLQRGLSPVAWETNWKSFESYVNTFPDPILQNALILATTHWDAYVSRLANFIAFARSYVTSPTLTPKQEKALIRVHFLPIPQQLPIMQEATHLDFGVPPPSVSLVYEMNLVRNLGLHNEWIVDATYLAHTSATKWSLGQLRTVDVAELESWRAALSDLIIATSKPIAAMYVVAPDFPPQVPSRPPGSA